MKPRSIIKAVIYRLYHPVLSHYLAKPRRYRSGDVNLIILPGVFHPGLFFSTRLLVSFLDTIDLSGKSLLELGAGSGLIAIRTSRRGAVVTATDISGTALRGLRENAARNGADISIIESDLFGNLPGKQFDIIIINPPYYPRAAIREDQLAWYCGPQFEYFQRLFDQLPPYITAGSQVLMILSEDCRIDHIQALAAARGLTFTCLRKHRGWWERNYIFGIGSEMET